MFRPAAVDPNGLSDQRKTFQRPVPGSYPILPSRRSDCNLSLIVMSALLLGATPDRQTLRRSNWFRTIETAASSSNLKGDFAIVSIIESSRGRKSFCMVHSIQLRAKFLRCYQECSRQQFSSFLTDWSMVTGVVESPHLAKSGRSPKLGRLSARSAGSGIGR
jgi:hypothetical protein